MTMGQLIQNHRKNRGLTQKELAEQLGLATGTIQQYELDKRQPRIELLQQIAAVLDVEILDLIPEEPKTDKFSGLSEETKAYIKELCNGDEVLESILATVLCLPEDAQIRFLHVLKQSINEAGDSCAIDPQDDK